MVRGQEQGLGNNRKESDIKMGGMRQGQGKDMLDTWIGNPPIGDQLCEQDAEAPDITLDREPAVSNVCSVCSVCSVQCVVCPVFAVFSVQYIVHSPL